MKRIATPLLVSTIALAGAYGDPATAAPVPTTPAVTAPTSTDPPPARLTGPGGQLELPADAQFYTDLSNIFRQRPFRAADGSFSWLYSRQRSPDDGRGLGVASVKPPIPADGQPPVPFGFSTVKGTAALRGMADWTGRAFPLATSVDGGTWFADPTLTPRPARTRIVKFNDRSEATARIKLPKGIGASLLVPTARGLRVVGFETNRKKGQNHVVVSGPGVKGWTRDPYLSVNAKLSAAPLPDGSLLVSGSSRSGSSLPEPVLRVTPSGRIQRLGDRRAVGAAATTGAGGFAATKLGVAMFESGGAAMPLANVKDAVVIRGPKGKVVARKYLRDVDLGLSEFCNFDGARRWVGQVFAGPDGLPVLSVVCNYYGSSNGSSFYGQSYALVGLGDDLVPRWSRVIDPFATEYPDENYPCPTNTVGADARIWTISCQGRYIATDVPGLAPPATGKLTTVKKDGKLGAVARVRCNAAYGSVCAGIAAVTVAGKTVGQASYVVDGRPGRAAGTLDRHIPTPAPITGPFKVVLQPAG